MTFEELVKISDCHISFERISEPRMNGVQLRIIVNKSNNRSDLLIFPHQDSSVQTLQIDFENYITYSVIYDDFTIWNDTEVFRGGSFRIYEKSNYLDFILRESNLPREGLTHYSLSCFEHQIDIISKFQPVIKEIDSDSLTI